jgi:PAS domain S-box-containing protein
LHTHTRNAADLAERDLLAAILDAAAEDRGVERYLSQIIAHLGKYAKTNCVGIILFAGEEVLGSTMSHGCTAEFMRIPEVSFPGSEKCICSRMLKEGSNIRPASSTQGRAYFRNSNPAASTRTDIADEVFGICVGCTFESVALIPIGDQKTAAGFIFVGDERRDMIPQRKLKLLERAGSHVVIAAGAILALDEKTTSRETDEMELVTRLIENSNESIVITQDWRIIYVNKKCADMAGLSKDDMIGLAFLDITHPDDRAAVKERYSRILNGEWFPTGTVLRGLDKDGNTRWAELREIPFSWHGRPAVMSLVNDITDRRQAEEALAESEKKYKVLADNSLQGIVIAQGTSPRIAYCNAAMAGLTGYTSGELLSMTPQQIVNLIHPDDRDMFFERYAARIKGLPVEPRYEFRAVRQDGAVIWIEIFATAIEYLGEPAIQAAFVDNTDRKRAEETVRESEERYRILAEKANDIIWTTDINLHTTYVSPSVERITGFTVEERMKQDVTQMMTPQSIARATEALAEHLALEQDPKADPNRTLIIELGYYRKDGSTIWLENQVSSLRDASGTLVGFHGVARDVTERRRAREILRVSEERYRLLVETANEAIAVIQDGVLKFVSPKIEDISGYKVADIMARSFTDFIHPDDRQMVADHYIRRLRGEESAQTYQFRLTGKAGNTKWVQVNAVIFDWDEKPATLALISDITERMKAAEALKASEERYRLLADNAADVIFTADLFGTPTYVSPSILHMLGYTVDEAMQRPLTLTIAADSLKAAMTATVEQLSKERAEGPDLPRSWTQEIEMIRSDGSRIWTETSMSFTRKPDGKPIGIMGLVRDISDRKKAEQALKASEEKFRALAEDSSDMIVLLNKSGVISYESPAAGRLLGLTPEERIGERPFDRVHPDDLPRVTEAFGELMRHPGASPKRLSELRLQHTDGSWRTMEATGSTVVRDGDVEGIVVTLHDITERKKAEEALKASEERFRTIIENSRDAVTIVDENFSVMYESPSLGTVTGYSPEEWLGKSLADMQVHPDDVPFLASEFEKLKSQPGLVIEDACVRYKHTDGSWHVIEATARNLLHDPRVNGIVVNFRDITTRKRAEEAQRESELRYRLLAENASDVIFTSDLAMKLTYVSPSVTQLTGYSPEETMSQDVDRWVAPSSRDFVSKSFAWALDKAKSGIDLPRAMRTATLEMLRKEGGTVWAEIRIDFLRNASRQPMGILGVARDITDRRIAEMELERRSQLETLITEISTAFIGISTDYIDQGIQNALESISRFTGVDCSYIFMFNEDRTEIHMAHEWCSKEIEPLIGRLHSLRADGLPFLAGKAKAAEYVHVPDLAALPAAAEAERVLLQNHGVQSVILVPMLQAGNAIGLFGLSSVHSKKTWDDETIVLLRLVAEMFSNAMERKRMDSALRESEKRYRLLAENITDVIWTTDMQANITYMSPSATRLLGFTTEELGKMTVADLLMPDSFERGMEALAKRQVPESQEPEGQPDYWTLEVEMRCKDGSTVWVEETVAFLRDVDGTPIGLVGVTRDISRRKMMEDALRLSEDKYRTLVEASPDGVLSLDSRGVIADCNTGLCRMLGYERKQLCGREARLLATKKTLDAEPYYREHLIRGEFVEIETEILRHDGHLLPVWAKVVRLEEPRTADIQTIIYFRDIADRRKIDEMKDEFVGLVSHELRSPLTVIIGALHTAISEGPRLSQKETRQLLEDAASEAEQLSHLVGNLLELSRAQANRLILHVEPINMAKAVHKVIGSIERQSARHKYIINLPKKLPPVSADQLRLERILYNLLENSAKYSPEGSEITVSAKRDAGHLVVSVTDQGPGISKEDQAKLFKPFQQLGDPMLDHTKGAGLGLLVCRRLVEAHGGRIWVESEPGHGASFCFTLEASTKNGPDSG